MARTSTGRSVARAASTGGGRTYRGQRPTNFYAALAIIVVVGLLSVFYARYEYQHAAPAAAGQPTTAQTWYSAFGFDICGTQQASPPANSNSSLVGIYTTGNGLMTIHPKGPSETGSNATLGKFVSNYPGNQMTLTANAIGAPTSRLYRNGQTCPKGTPDAGKSGVVTVRYWTGPLATNKSGRVVTGDPRNLKLTNGQLITMAFAPAGTTIKKPPTAAIAALLPALSGQAPTTTTLPTTGTLPQHTSTTIQTTPPASSTTRPPTSTSTTAAK
ncbi:MAG TPA: hypothetical protein VKG43_01770 [Acidimicrobiales bacterium]|nr:hypothetical protein [Acidimicrobiales bacterium]